MDVSNLTTANSVAAPVAKTKGTVGANVPVVHGNPLPDAAQVRARSDKSQVEKSQSEALASPPSTEELRELVGQANESLQARFSDLKFTVDEGTDISVVRVEDSETGELIRQFPSKAMIAIARALDEMQQGSVFEEKV